MRRGAEKEAGLWREEARSQIVAGRVVDDVTRRGTKATQLDSKAARALLVGGVPYSGRRPAAAAIHQTPVRHPGKCTYRGYQGLLRP